MMMTRNQKQKLSPKKIRQVRRGEFVPSLQIIDNRNDRVEVISKSDWDKYSNHCTILGELLIHRVVTVLTYR
jgi:hypothetical protein